MRLFSIFLMACALSHAAMAQTSECRLVADPIARLACYDRAAPPAVAPVPATPVARAAPASDVDSTKYVDSVDAEDAAMNARIKGICRGC